MRFDLTRIKLNGRTTATTDEHAIDSVLTGIPEYQLNTAGGSETQRLAVPLATAAIDKSAKPETTLIIVPDAACDCCSIIRDEKMLAASSGLLGI